MNKHLVASLAALTLLLTACTVGRGTPPIINKSPYRVIPAETVVKEDDSIYSVAWRFGLDFRKIAKWNGLAKPYPVRPGQRLRLRSSSSPQTAAATPTPAPSRPKPAAIPKPAVPKPAVPKPTPAAAAAPIPTTDPSKWKWPATGQLIGKFSPGKGQNGIKIAGAAGSAVRASAAGTVVYAGEGLRGYGKLIIVKHSDAYLSAYAHNRAILVGEGAQVKSGQQIAQMGNSDADRTMLHFEIRKDSKPVDPLKFLN